MNECVDILSTHIHYRVNSDWAELGYSPYPDPIEIQIGIQTQPKSVELRLWRIAVNTKM